MKALPTTRHYSQVMSASAWQLNIFLVDTTKISLLSLEKQKQLCKEMNALIQEYVREEKRTSSGLEGDL